jgi:hypothetical protein
MDIMARLPKRRAKAQPELLQSNLRRDYSNIPEKVKNAIVPMQTAYVVEETSKVTWDGRQFIVRIPKEIAEEAGITTESRISFKFASLPPESTEKSEGLLMKLV